MNTTTCFKSVQGNCYLYDSEKKQIVTTHPIISHIAELEKNELLKDETTMEILKKKFPIMEQSDIFFYIQKYFFLKKNGFFQKKTTEESLSGRLTPHLIESQLANLGHVLFQVTAECNLKCRYCCYGDLYENPESAQTGSMTFQQAKQILDFLIPYWNSNKNVSYNNTIIIAFYGGEPLVNFTLINEIVTYVKNIRLNNNANFVFSMTTNSLLLDRYMNFLVNNNFSLLLSLDGNEIHDYLRVDQRNNPTFKKVFDNIKKMQRTYPDYFAQNVQFNSLLNNKSTPEEVFEFINREFNKIPMIGTLSTNGLRSDKIDEFKKIYRPYSESPYLTKKMASMSTVNKNAGYFFYYHISNSYKQYYELLMLENKKVRKIPTGTCLPFLKKMFISCIGKIYPCERIGLEQNLGEITEDGVILNFNNISNIYNSYFNSLDKQCSNCYLEDYCSECMFQFDFKNGLPICKKQKNRVQFENYLSSIINGLESNPENFDNINKMTFA